MTAHPFDLDRAVLSTEEAFRAVLADVTPIRRATRIAVDAAAGRIAAQDAISLVALPPFDQSAVDGYGIGTMAHGGGNLLSVTSEIAAGDGLWKPLVEGQAIRMATGAAVPPGVTAVAMREHCRVTGGGVVLERQIPAGANIRRRGEDVAKGSALFQRGILLDARHVAIAAAAGLAELEITEVLRVGIVSTGNELRQQGAELEPHEVYDANRPLLKALLRAPWLELIDGGIVRDDTDALAVALTQLTLRTDAIVTTGGAMGSDTDHTAAAILSAGGSATSVRIAQRPGKPIVVGSLAGIPVIGLPGNTTAAMVNCMLYARPMLTVRAGGLPARALGQPALAYGDFDHTPARTDFLPVRIVKLAPDGRPMLERLSKGGSARLYPFVLADGLAELPAATTSVDAGDPIIFHPFLRHLCT